MFPSKNYSAIIYSAIYTDVYYAYTTRIYVVADPFHARSIQRSDSTRSRDGRANIQNAF